MGSADKTISLKGEVSFSIKEYITEYIKYKDSFENPVLGIPTSLPVKIAPTIKTFKISSPKFVPGTHVGGWDTKYPTLFPITSSPFLSGPTKTNLPDKDLSMTEEIRFFGKNTVVGETAEICVAIDANKMLSEHGIYNQPFQFLSIKDAMVAAEKDIQYPLVLKTSIPGRIHSPNKLISSKQEFLNYLLLAQTTHPDSSIVVSIPIPAPATIEYSDHKENFCIYLAKDYILSYCLDSKKSLMLACDNREAFGRFSLDEEIVYRLVYSGDFYIDNFFSYKDAQSAYMSGRIDTLIVEDFDSFINGYITSFAMVESGDIGHQGRLPYGCQFAENAYDAGFLIGLRQNFSLRDNGTKYNDLISLSKGPDFSGILFEKFGSNSTIRQVVELHNAIVSKNLEDTVKLLSQQLQPADYDVINRTSLEFMIYLLRAKARAIDNPTKHSNIGPIDIVIPTTKILGLVFASGQFRILSNGARIQISDSHIIVESTYPDGSTKKFLGLISSGFTEVDVPSMSTSKIKEFNSLKYELPSMFNGSSQKYSKLVTVNGNLVSADSSGIEITSVDVFLKHLNRSEYIWKEVV